MKERIDEAMHKLEDLLGIGGTHKDIAFLAISGAALLLSLALPEGVKAALPFDLCWVAIILCGVPIICEAIIGLVTEFDITADVLVALALIASVAIGETFAAGEVAVIMQLGGLLEELTVARARAGIERLVHLTPRTARRVGADGAEVTIPAEEVQVGDLLRVNPGETVPVDGSIVSGETSIDQSVMTGESIPVDLGPGDAVSSGTINRFGSFDMLAERVGEDSSMQRMVRLVQSADAGKAKIVNLADRWAVWIVVIALSAAAITWAATGLIIRAVTILVVFCPCSLVLATPTAIMAAIGNATKHGFLVREGDALERLAGVTRVALDKTGTLTYGTPKVISVEVDEGSDVNADTLYRFVGTAERKSEHPLGKAIVAGWKASAADASANRRAETCGSDAIGAIAANGTTASAVTAGGADGHDDGEVAASTIAPGGASAGNATLPEPTSFAMLPGRGVDAVCANSGAPVEVLAGNRELMAERGLELPQGLLSNAEKHLSQGCTVTYVALVSAGSKPSFGFVALADTPRENASATISGIREAGSEPVLLTGDNPAAAAHVAAELGITNYQAECKPEDKLGWICASEEAGNAVCMVGDGVNDAPALKRAQVGIAMGGIGSDIAVDAADIALVSDEVSELPHLLALSRRMMTTIKCNLTFSMTLNFVAIVLAITGVLSPVVGALVHNAGSVLVITNSALLLGWKRRR